MYVVRPIDHDDVANLRLLPNELVCERTEVEAFMPHGRYVRHGFRSLCEADYLRFAVGGEREHGNDAGAKHAAPDAREPSPVRKVQDGAFTRLAADRTHTSGNGVCVRVHLAIGPAVIAGNYRELVRRFHCARAQHLADRLVLPVTRLAVTFGKFRWPQLLHRLHGILTS